MNELASRLRAQPEGDLSLAVAAVALGIGVVVAFQRMQDPWADFPLLLLVAGPCAVLFALALAPGSGGEPVGTRGRSGLRPWQTACLLVAIPLLAGSILLLIKASASTPCSTGTWVLAHFRHLPPRSSVRFDSPGATILASVALAAAALTAVNWADEHAQLASYRDVALLEGLVFLAFARMMWGVRHLHAKQLVAVGGLTLIGGAMLGNGAGDIGSPLRWLWRSRLSKDGWTLELIVVTIGMLAFAAWQRHGGSAFVGLLGVYAFTVITATGGDLSGWPLILGIVTVLCLVWALVVRPRRGKCRRRAPMPHAPQPPRLENRRAQPLHRHHPLVWSGCGGSNDEQQIRDVYASYIAALDSGDAVTTCSYFTPTERRNLPGTTGQLFRGPPGHRRPPPKFSSCARAVHTILPIFKATQGSSARSSSMATTRRPSCTAEPGSSTSPILPHRRGRRSSRRSLEFGRSGPRRDKGPRIDQPGHEGPVGEGGEVASLPTGWCRQLSPGPPPLLRRPGLSG